MPAGGFFGRHMPSLCCIPVWYEIPERYTRYVSLSGMVLCYSFKPIDHNSHPCLLRTILTGLPTRQEQQSHKSITIKRDVTESSPRTHYTDSVTVSISRDVMCSQDSACFVGADSGSLQAMMVRYNTTLYKSVVL